MARFGRTITRLVVVLALAGLLVAGALVGVGYSASRLAHDIASAPEEPLPDLQTAAQLPSVIYAANGAVLATLRSAEYRQPVPLSKVSPILVHAVLDTEDHGFYVHGGIDVESIARALLADISAGGAVQGGSTIAQELVKNVYLTDQKTVSRKVREAVLAERLEQKYTKDQILDAYLNTVYLGSGAYGVQAAAKEYFNKNADQLNVAEAALLAGLLQAPSGYDPLTNPLGARLRRSEVLSRMVHYRTITPAEALKANETPLPTELHGGPGASYVTKGWYVTQVVDELLDNPVLGATTQEREHALFGGGLKIYTNEIPSLQAYAQQTAVDGIPSSLPGVVAAFAVMDPKNGNVEALVGGPSGSEGQFDDATQGLRQPGSGFKLFALIAALEEGYNVNDTILGESPCAIVFPGNPYYGTHPMNNDPGDPNGVVSLVQATADSINCAYLRLAYEVSLSKLVAVAKSMGVSEDLPTNEPSIVLGTADVHPIEMTAAYATVADGGIYHTPTFINRIVDQSGNVIYDGETAGRRVFSPLVAQEALEALQATVQYGTGTAAALPNADVAGKTGTTELSDDAWFNGITPTFAASVWIGDPVQRYPMYIDGDEVYGASFPTQIWRAVAQYALRDTPDVSWPQPDYDLLPPIKYIISPGLEQDDLYDHGYPPPVVTTTVPRPSTTTKPASTSPKTPPPTNSVPSTPSGSAPTLSKHP